MAKTLELQKSDLVSVLAAVQDPCGPWLPGREPIRGWIPSDPEACKHWLEMVAIVKVADVAIEQALSRQRTGEALGGNGAEAALTSNRSDLQQLVDDFCGTPPRWPLPWPPQEHQLDPKGLSPVQLLVLGARFQAAFDQLGEHALAPELESAADRLLEVGMARMAERRQ